MRKSIIVLLIFISVWARAQETGLKIQSITEYIDGYVITGIDAINIDTLFIVSKKENITELEMYDKIEVGKQYVFQIDDKVRQMTAMPPENFTVRIITTVVWRSGDGCKNIPVFAKNLKGVYIEK